MILELLSDMSLDFSHQISEILIEFMIRMLTGECQAVQKSIFEFFE
jgi:hypothetical protein